MAQEVVVKVPVCDATVSPAKVKTGYNQDISKLFMNLPNYPEPGQVNRSSQLLFNERLYVRQKKGDQLCCEAPHIAYSNEHGELNNIFWLPVSAIVFSSCLSNEERAAIPDLYSQKTYAHCLPSIALTYAWQDPLSKMTYSFGTRFVHEPTLDTATEYGIRFNTYKDKKVCKTRISRDKACLHYPRSIQESRQLFVRYLKAWAHNNYSIYIWGGMSHRGLDCSGLVLRAAQLAGAPYFYRTTLTLAHFLKPLKEGDVLQEGDLIFHEGHVMIVSDIKNNRLIESASLPETGWGRVHELPLSSVFKNITTYKDLLQLYHKPKPYKLERLHKDGHVYRVVDTIKIFRFATIFDT
ncbi:MAG TPA: NlpC/P60 family protein [Candidatus Babeliaceae bacterium]|nr:NlpC/P60 family protein [Candidatus Babeliaceae bacterium]